MGYLRHSERGKAGASLCECYYSGEQEKCGNYAPTSEGPPANLTCLWYSHEGQYERGKRICWLAGIVKLGKDENKPRGIWKNYNYKSAYQPKKKE